MDTGLRVPHLHTLDRRARSFARFAPSISSLPARVHTAISEVRRQSIEPQSPPSAIVRSWGSCQGLWSSGEANASEWTDTVVRRTVAAKYRILLGGQFHRDGGWNRARLY